MLKLFVLLYCLLIPAYAGILPNVPGNFLHRRILPRIDERIIGGTPADIMDAPYQVVLFVDWYGLGIYSQVCGGSIISESVIISAAICPYNTEANQWNIRAGSTISDSGGQLKEVTKLILHEEYDFWRYDYDIALFFLSSPFIINGVETALVPLPAQNASVADGASAFVTGWGSTEDDRNVTVLHKLTIPIVNQDYCIQAYSEFNPVTPRMICAGILDVGGQDACDRDTGGPLTIDGVLIGITSWGIGCGYPIYPGVWTRVPAFRNWIDSNVLAV